MADQFAAMCGVDAATAAMYMEMSGGSLDVAVSLFFDSGGAPPAAPAAAAASAAAAPAPAWWRVITEKATLPPSWTNQSLLFSGASAGAWCAAGLVQSSNGPCGVLAALQAILVVQRIATIDASYAPTPADVADAIAALISAPALAAGTATCAVARWTDGAGIDAEELAGAIAFDDVPTDAVAAHVAERIGAFTARGGLVLIVASAVRTRTAEAVARDVAQGHGGDSTLIVGPNAFCSTELMALLLRGVANGDISAYSAMAGGAKQSWLDKSATGFALPVGLISSDEIESGVPLVDELKTPAQRVWVLHGGDHFTTAWVCGAFDPAADAPDGAFELVHWNGLAPGVCATTIRVDATAHGAAPPAPPRSDDAGGVATFYKPVPGQIDDVVQAHPDDKRARPDQWATHRYEVILAIDDPDVDGKPRPEGMSPPRIYPQGECDATAAWRCAACYRGRFKTMCFGGNEAGAVVCAHCSKPREEAGWSIYVPYAELTVGWRVKLTQRYGPKLVKLLQTKWPGAKIDWDGFPGKKPHV
jgi:hypothetical protein